MHKAVTPRLVEAMRERAESITGGLLAAAERSGRMDLIRDYALPLPTTIIAEMLGVPPDERQQVPPLVERNCLDGFLQMGHFDGDSQRHGVPAVHTEVVRLRRADPRDDPLSALVNAEDSGQQLDEDELLAMVFLLLITGHETTVNLIGNGTLALRRHPDQKTLLRDNPALIKPAVEELLRYESPLETATETVCAPRHRRRRARDTLWSNGFCRHRIGQPGRTPIRAARYAGYHA